VTVSALLTVFGRRPLVRAISASAILRVPAGVAATGTLVLTLPLAATALREDLLWDFVRVGLEAGNDFASNLALDQPLDIAKKGMLVDAHQ